MMILCNSYYDSLDMSNFMYIINYFFFFLNLRVLGIKYLNKKKKYHYKYKMINFKISLIVRLNNNFLPISKIINNKIITLKAFLIKLRYLKYNFIVQCSQF
jgi:hypothetical protein